MTPEGKIKEKIKELLDNHSGHVYYYMPVPGGYGRTTIDYLICFDGLFVGIEAKKPKGKPTSRQEGVLEDIRAAGGAAFVVNDEESLGVLEKFFISVLQTRRRA